MQTPDSTDKKNKGKSAFITLITSGSFILLTIILGFTPPAPQLEPEGLLVDFGFDQMGIGTEEPTSKISGGAPPAASAKAIIKQQPITQDIEETVALPDKKQKEKQVVTETKTKTTTKKETKPEPQIDNKQVYDPSKHKFDTGSTSEGNTSGTGNMGKPDGDPSGYQGEGSGIGDNGKAGVGFSLAGRSIIKHEPGGNPPESGKLVFKISVDKNGIIKSAEYERKGSTIVDQNVIADAKSSLLNKKWFNPKSDAPDIQSGTLTINYTLQ